MHMIVYIKVVMSQQLHTCTGCKNILECIHHASNMSLITAIGTNHVKISTSLKDSGLQNKLAKSNAKKWTTMAQVLQDVADMAVDFERSHGYSLPTFNIQYVSSANSSSSYRSNKPPTKGIQQLSTWPEKPKCWHCQGEHFKKDCPTAPKQSSPTKYKSTQEKQHNLIKTFCKKFQDKRQINEISTPTDDNCNEEFDNFISEFENIMLEDSDNSSAWLAAPNASVINEVFIDGFHALYNIQIDNLHTLALFDTGTPINTISLKFYSSVQQHVKMLPSNRKVVSADSDSLGPIGEVYVKFKLGMVVFTNIFVILNNLQHDIILGLPWQCNYRIGCTWNREGKHFLTIRNKFLALCITPHKSKQLVITKGQCTLQGRSITWISVKTQRNIQVNSLFEITLDRQLPKRLIPLDVLHNIQHKQLQEMLIPLLNTVNSVVKLLKNTVLGSITKMDNAEYVQNISSLQPANDKVHDQAQQQQEAKPLLPVLPDSLSFQTHAHYSNKSPIQLQDVNVLLEIQCKLNTMPTSKFTGIISKSPTDFGRTNLIEMDLPTTGPPVSTKPYTIPLKYKSFIDE